MSEKKAAKSAKKATKNAAGNATKKSAAAGGWSAEEREAMKERAREMKAEKRAGGRRAAGEADLRAKIGEMKGSDRELAERLHALIMETAPALEPKTWYGMPAYAKDGKVVCFFQAADKFSTRYATLGFSDSAALDDGTMWPTSFALTRLTAADEKRIAALVKKAAG